MGTQFVENLDIMRFLVVLSAFVAASQAAPQLVYPYGLGYSHAITHAVPTTVKKTLTYKTAAFEPVDAATPADAQKIELKETEHSLDYLVPGPVKYVTSHVAPPASYAARKRKAGDNKSKGKAKKKAVEDEEID